MTCLAFMITSSEIGGAQRWLFDQVLLLQDEVDVIVITNRKGWLTEKLKRETKCLVYCIAGVESYILPSVVLRLRGIVKAHNITTLIASSASAGVYSRIVGLISSTRVVYVSHGWSALYNFGRFKVFGAILERTMSWFSNQVVCVSKSDYDVAIDFIGINPEKLTLITNGIFDFNLSARQCVSKTPKILCVSRLEHPKRVDLVIRAVRLTECDLYIVGHGSQYSTLLDLARNNERIKFLGEIEDFKDFSNYDIFILLSESEGLPISAIEAMASGLPLILSDVGGCSELISDNGCLVNHELEVIEHAIYYVISNYSKLSAGSVRHFNNNFNISKKISVYKRAYSID